MYMNLKPNQHKRISFNTTTMTSLGFIGPPKIQLPPKFNFLLRSLNYFGLELLGPPPPKNGRKLLPCWNSCLYAFTYRSSSSLTCFDAVFIVQYLPDCMTWKETWMCSRDWWKNHMFLGFAFLQTLFWHMPWNR